LSKLERVKANSIEKANIVNKYHILQCNLNILAPFAFTRFYLRVLADLNEIIRRLKRNVILRNAIVLKNLILPRIAESSMGHACPALREAE